MEALPITAHVGARVREFRGQRRMTQQQLADEMASYDQRWSQSICAQAEAGKRPISVAELLALGLALGVAPHLLLYPLDDADVDVGQEYPLHNSELVRWLWRPDRHRWTAEGTSEASLVADLLEAGIQRLEDEAGELGPGSDYEGITRL